MKQLILDAGPLIGLFYEKDTHHSECKRGFRQLARKSTILLIPFPIVFEVYKWLLHRVSPENAQTALKAIKASFHCLILTETDFDELQQIVDRRPQWQGSLEDGTVVLLASKYRSPIWTYNYRDFGSFKTLEFWNPDASGG